MSGIVVVGAGQAGFQAAASLRACSLIRSASMVQKTPLSRHFTAF